MTAAENTENNVVKARRCILHIGVEKTGTTTFQQVMADNRERLSKAGILYPESAGPENHIRLVVAALDFGTTDNIKRTALQRTKWREDQYRAEFLADFQIELTEKPKATDGNTSDAPDWTTLVLSSELISSRLHTDAEVSRLINWIKPHVETIEVVVFLRRQDRLAESRFSSRLRQGETELDAIFTDGSHRAFPDAPASRLISDHENWFNYDRLIRRYEDAGQREGVSLKIRPVIYDAPEGRSDVLAVFSDILGFDLRAQNQTADLSLNAAMSTPAQMVVAKLNHFVPYADATGASNKIRMKLIGELEKRLDGPRRHVHRSAAIAFFQQFQLSNQAVQDRYFRQNNELFSQDFSSYASDPSPRAGMAENMRINMILVGFLGRYAVARAGDKGRGLLAKLFRAMRKVVGLAKRRLKALRLRIKNPILRVAHLQRVHLRVKAPEALKYGRDRSCDFTIARIVGNDLPPRQSSGQMLSNLRFIIENEPAFERCQKVFLLNRLTDPELAGKARDLILGAGHRLLERPFEAGAYREYCEGLGQEALRQADQSLARFQIMKAYGNPSIKKAHDLALAQNVGKIRFAVDINGARNAALEHGKAETEWTFVLDGSCFLAAQAGERLFEDLSRGQPFAPFLAIPMRRLSSFAELEDPNIEPDWKEEPQLAFHRTSKLKFNEDMVYGFRDKSHLLADLGIPGPWQSKSPYDWVPATVKNARERSFFRYAPACVLRLPPHPDAAKRDDNKEDAHRYRVRLQGLLDAVESLDKTYRQGF